MNKLVHYHILHRYSTRRIIAWQGKNNMCSLWSLLIVSFSGNKPQPAARLYQQYQLLESGRNTSASISSCDSNGQWVVAATSWWSTMMKAEASTQQPVVTAWRPPNTLSLDSLRLAMHGPWIEVTPTHVIVLLPTCLVSINKCYNTGSVWGLGNCDELHRCVQSK